MKQMTWECAPEEYKSSYYARPDEYVRFRFVENPHCEEVESSRDFCVQLRNSGKDVVNVEFKVWQSIFGVRGHRMIAVDGHALQNVGGWGYVASNDYSGPCPLDKVPR